MKCQCVYLCFIINYTTDEQKIDSYNHPIIIISFLTQIKKRRGEKRKN